MKRRLALLLFGVAVIGVAGLVHARQGTDGSRTIFTSTVVAVVTLVVLRLAVDWLLRDKPAPKVLKYSDVRRTRPPVIRRWRSRGSTYSPTFFRAPPAFADFEDDYVLTHPRLVEIADHVRSIERGLVLIEGPPASGKSTLLRHLEFTLTRPRVFRRRRAVFVCGCKNLLESDLEGIKDDIVRLPRRSIVLLDDVHLFLLKLTGYAETYRSRDVVLVYGSRPLINYAAEQVQALRSLQPTTFAVDAGEVATSIIDRFLTVEHELEDPAASRATYEAYATDLWLLSAALQASRLDAERVARVSKKDVNAWILRNTLSEMTLDGHTVSRATVMAPIAALYRFEVSTDQWFLTDKLAIDPAAVGELIKSGDILRAGHAGSVRLHHSSLAHLIVDALSSSEGAGLLPQISGDRHIGDRPWCDQLVREHIEASPLRSATMLVDVSRSNASGRELGIGILRSLGLERFQAALAPTAASVEVVGGFLELWREAGKPHSVGLDSCARRYIDQSTEEGARSWAWATYNAARLDPDLGLAFADKLSPLLASEPPTVIADIGTHLSYASKDLSLRAFAQIDHSATLTRLQSDGMTANELAMEFAKLVWVDERFGENVAGGLFEVIPSLSAFELPPVLSRIAWGSPHVARNLLIDSSAPRLAALLSATPSAVERYEALSTIANVALPAAQALVTEGPMPSWPHEAGMASLFERIMAATSEAQVHLTEMPDIPAAVAELMNAAPGTLIGGIGPGTPDDEATVCAMMLADWASIGHAGRSGARTWIANRAGRNPRLDRNTLEAMMALIGLTEEDVA